MEINAALPKEVAKKYKVVGVKAGHKVQLNWSVFATHAVNGKELQRVGVPISAPKPEGTRIKRYIETIDFSKATIQQMEGLLQKHCPYIERIPDAPKAAGGKVAKADTAKQ